MKSESHKLFFRPNTHLNQSTGDLFCLTEKETDHMSRDARKPVLGIADQVQNKPDCTTTEDG